MAAPTEDDIANCLELAHQYARGRARGELREAAVDGATDAIAWAVRKYDPELGGNWEAFAMSAVRKCVKRAILQHLRNRARRPVIHSLPIGDEDDCEPTLAALCARQTHGIGEVDLSLTIRELPDEVQAAVRFFYLDRFTLRECSLLMGCGREKVRELLKEAARLLSGSCHVPHRRPNSRRIMR
jgi:DNA-directed RNA polymerase specialized sigma24 family protein